MGNQNPKLPIRSQSVPDTQRLGLNGSFSRIKSRSSQRLQRLASSNDITDESKTQWPVPLAEALFLPEFPIRGDIEDQDFEIIDVIAKGAYGNVLKVHREDEKQVYAMKVLDKKQLIVEGAIQQCKDEAAIQHMLGDHPFIVKTHEYWQSRKHLFIVLDYIPNGEMFTLWTYHGRFPEKLVKYFMAELSMTIGYLHKSGVIYRDIKMENILFDAQGHIQLTDFGLAKWLDRGQKTKTVCGTLQYMAPEVLAVYPYGHTADWWSLGILMYAMLAGRYPVDGATNHLQMAHKVFECDYLLPNYVSDRAQDVINKLLTKSPSRRLTDLYSFQQLPFFKNIDFTSVIERKFTPRELVDDEFFPMSARSVAPPEPEEENDVFADFDYCVWNLPPDSVAVYV